MDKVILEEVVLDDTDHVLDFMQTDPFKERCVVGINQTNYPKNKYELSAYPGPGVVSDKSRTEHLPYHLHARSPNLGEMKIDIQTLEIIGTADERKRTVPKELRKHLEKNKKFYENAIMQVFHTGRFDRKIEKYEPPVQTPA